MGADTLQALEEQGRAHHLGEAAADGQAQAGAGKGSLAVRVGLGEGGEQALPVIVVDANAAVAYLQHQGRPGFGARLGDAGLDAHVAVLGELDRIADQVGQDLLESQGVEQGVAAGAGGDFCLQHQALLPGLAFEHSAHRSDQCRHVDRLRRQ